MERKTAETFLPLVNTVEYYDLLQRYAEYRITRLHKSLEQAGDFNEVLRIQGQIKELRRFDTLRNEVLSSDKETGK